MKEKKKKRAASLFLTEEPHPQLEAWLHQNMNSSDMAPCPTERSAGRMPTKGRAAGLLSRFLRTAGKATLSQLSFQSALHPF